MHDQLIGALKGCGFTDTGARPSVLGVNSFSFLPDFLGRGWDNIDDDEKMAMVAAHARTQNKAVITITDDIAAQGIASVIPAYLNDRMKGRVVIASMKGAEQKTRIGYDTIEENGILFSAILANAVKEIGTQLIGSKDQELFILNILPPINSKAFEEFIHSLMDIKTAVEATASAA